MYGAIALPHPSFLFSRERTGTWQQMVSVAAIGVCFSVAGLLITGSPRVTTPQQHQIDNRGQTPAASVVIQMNAAPAYQETEPEAEQLPPPQESPSQAELATARRTTPEKTTKPPSAKPAVKTRRNQNRLPQQPPQIPEKIKPHSSSPAGRRYPRQILPPQALITGKHRRITLTCCDKKLRNKNITPAGPAAPGNGGSALSHFHSTITANRLHRSLPALPVMNYWIMRQWMPSSGLLLSVHRRRAQSGG